LKKVNLDLGGNSAVILEPDADLNAAVARIVQGGFGFSGQVCISVQRVYIHQSIARDFRGLVTTAAEKLRVGHPSEESTQIATLISEEAARRVEQWTSAAVQARAKLLTGGTQRRSTIVPGILADVPEQSTFMQHELFGPLAAVNSYGSLNEAIDRVNGTPYGLQAGIYTQHLKNAAAHVGRILSGGDDRACSLHMVRRRPNRKTSSVGSGRARPWLGHSGKDGGKQLGRSGRAGYLSRHRRTGRRPDDQIGLGYIQPGVQEAGDDADRPGIA
jgi:hypothetical protein